jgi:phage FluMu protein Com
MQVRCTHCHRPFALGKEAVHYALDVVEEEGLNHYNAQCPHCKRMNRLSKEELMRAAPDWSPGEVEQGSEGE